ncbi:BnaCnng09580D [Brassica napus]|uniref:BnaCnng09580D protein n=2 Tax=Brassica TaxID=3705 RepID=A0A078HQH1_BRANA|nr:BnaCnng09580D [Brassica napus]
MLGTWKGVGVQHPPWSQSGWCPTQYQALPFKGALHWLAEDGPVVAYNPNDQNTCLLIHRSHDMSHASYGADVIVSETLTVSTGHLRILQLVASVDHQHLYIWTLVDYKRSIWRREHDDPISFTDLPWLQDWTFSDLNYMFMSRFVTHPETRKRILYPKPLCCHPYNPLLVYFCLPESIVSLDVATRQMKLITTLSKSSTQGVHRNEYDKVIPMTMHLDPSLIPDHGHVLQRRCKHRFFRV